MLHLTQGVRLAQKLEALVLADQRFEIPAVRHLGMLAVYLSLFRLMQIPPAYRVNMYNSNISVAGMVVFRIKGGNDLTERLLKRLNHRGNLHCVPASLKGKYVIR